MEKGESASSLMVDYLTERHPELRIGELLLKVFYIIFQGIIYLQTIIILLVQNYIIVKCIIIGGTKVTV